MIEHGHQIAWHIERTPRLTKQHLKTVQKWNTAYRQQDYNIKDDKNIAL